MSGVDDGRMARMLGNARNNRKNSPEGLNETEEGVKTRHLPVNFSFPFFSLSLLSKFSARISFRKRVLELAIPRKKLKLKSVYNFVYTLNTPLPKNPVK